MPTLAIGPPVGTRDQEPRRRGRPAKGVALPAGALDITADIDALHKRNPRQVLQIACALMQNQTNQEAAVYGAMMARKYQLDGALHNVIALHGRLLDQRASADKIRCVVDCQLALARKPHRREFTSRSPSLAAVSAAVNTDYPNSQIVVVSELNCAGHTGPAEIYVAPVVSGEGNRHADELIARYSRALRRGSAEAMVTAARNAAKMGLVDLLPELNELVVTLDRRANPDLYADLETSWLDLASRADQVKVIYAMVDPDGNVLYVGETKRGLERRLVEHRLALALTLAGERVEDHERRYERIAEIYASLHPDAPSVSPRDLTLVAMATTLTDPDHCLGMESTYMEIFSILFRQHGLYPQHDLANSECLPGKLRYFNSRGMRGADLPCPLDILRSLLGPRHDDAILEAWDAAVALQARLQRRRGISSKARLAAAASTWESDVPSRVKGAPQRRSSDYELD